MSTGAGNFHGGSRRALLAAGDIHGACSGGPHIANDAVHEFVQAAAEAIAARNRGSSGGTYRQRVYESTARFYAGRAVTYRETVARHD